ncbi:MAG: nuclease-related domain-containing protein [Oscillospiraceae bacterium]
MNNLVFILIILFIAAVLSAIYLERKPYIQKKKIGSEGEEKTNKILRKYARKHKCLLMTNVFLPLYDGTCEIDHILFGKFGISVIETKNISGELSGDGKQLIHKIGSKQYYMYNPKMQNESHVKNIQHHLNKAGYRNIPIYPFVVFTSNNIKFPSDIGIPISELEKNLKNLPDNKCSFKELYDAIRKIKVMSPVQKLRHNIELTVKNKQ